MPAPTSPPADKLSPLLDAMIREAIKARFAWAKLRHLYPEFIDDQHFMDAVADALLSPLATLQLLSRKADEVPVIVAKRRAEAEQEAEQEA